MTTITTRSGKGSPLSNAEVDSNFVSLNDDKVEASGDSMTGNLSFGDNNKAIFGAGSDLQIYHDGSNSYIDDAGSGVLFVRGNSQVILGKYTGERMFEGNADGSSYVFYDNSVKLHTTSTGIDVTGSVTADGLTVDGDMSLTDATPTINLYDSDDSTRTTLSNNSGFSYLTAYGSTSGTYGSFILSSHNHTTSKEVLRADNTNIQFKTDGTLRGRFLSNGDYVLYNDAGTSTDFYWDASTSRLGLGTTSPYRTLTVSGDQVVEGLLEVTAATPQILFSVPSGGLDSRIHNDGSGNFIFGTGTNSATPTERMRLTSSGNVELPIGNDQTIGQVFSTAHSSGNAGSIGLTISDGGGHSGVFVNNTHDGTYSDQSITFKTAEGGVSAATERMRINSFGNVGIGRTSSSVVRLSVAGTDATASNYAFEATNSSLATKFIVRNDGQSQFFKSDNSASMTLTSDGNLLVGTTTTTAGNEGMVYFNGSSLRVTRDSDEPLNLDRLTTDGSLVDFKKDGTTVGSIGVVGSDILYIGTSDGSDAGLNFDGDNSRINPCNGTGAATDGALDLGQSGARFKDLYLSGSAKLVADSAASAEIQLKQTGTGGRDYRISSTGSGYGSAGALIFYDATASNERARFDSAGNAVFGKTSANNTAAGTTIYNEQGISVVRNSNTTAIFNRLTSDGEIVAFRKDGTTVGSIGAAGSTAYFTAPTAGGVRFTYLTSTNAALFPCDTSGANADALHNIGHPTVRFRDLYLSGGAYLGGTAAANHLDDYEEGTWTIVDTSGAGLTFGATTGNYVKIGKLVTCSLQFTFANTTNTTNVSLGGLPFTSESSDNSRGAVSVGYNNSGNPIGAGLVGPNSTNFAIYTGSSQSTRLQNNQLSGASLYLSITYFAA